MRALPSHLDWMVIRVRAAPGATGFVGAIACQSVRTAASQHSGGLVGKVLGGVNQFGFQGDLMPDVLAVRDLIDFPSAEGHRTS